MFFLFQEDMIYRQSRTVIDFVFTKKIIKIFIIYLLTHHYKYLHTNEKNIVSNIFQESL